MMLEDEQRQLIRDLLDVTALKRNVVAQQLEMAASAFSDAIRENGKRSFPDEKLDSLLKLIEPELRSQRQGASDLRAAILESSLTQLRTLEVSIFGGLLDDVEPGLPFPAKSTGALLLNPYLKISSNLANYPWTHIIGGTKMGKTSLAYRYALEAKFLGYHVAFEETLQGLKGSKSSAADVMGGLYEKICGDSERAKKIAACSRAPNMLPKTFASEFKVWLEKVASAHKSEKVVIIIDSLDDLIGTEFDVVGQLELIAQCLKSVVDVSRDMVRFVTFSTPYMTADYASPSDVISLLFVQTQMEEIRPLSPAASHNLSRYFHDGIDEDDCEELVLKTCGNIFLSHLYASLKSSLHTSHDIESFIGEQYKDGVSEIEIDNRFAIKAIRDHKKSALKAWEIVSKIFEDKQIYPHDVISTLEAIISEKGEISKYDRIHAWMRQMGLINLHGDIGLSAPILEKILKFQKGARHG